MSTEQIYEATFSRGGFEDLQPCVYVIVMSKGKKRMYYVGRTQTSNNTGTSSPYKRLGTHLAKRGNTQSVFWESGSILRDEWFLEAEIRFFALPVASVSVGIAEKWLMTQFPVEKLLNCNPTVVSPELDSNLKKKLRRLLEKAEG